MKEGTIYFEDLNWIPGESLDEGSLYFYTPEEREFRKEIQAFAREEILSRDAQIEKEASFEICREIVRIMGKKNILGLSFPKELGGGGHGYVMRTIFGEELAAINSAVVVTYGASANLFSAPIIHFGTAEQKKKYLPPILTGEKLGGIAITEPTAGSDAIGGMRCTAVKKGSSYLLNGEKRFITNGSKADYLLLYALTNLENPSKHRSISAFIIETDSSGFERVKDFETCGRRGMCNSQLRFNDLEIPEENLVGGPEMENKGVQIMMGGLDGERCFTSSQYIGIARSAYEVAFKYANLRNQFNKYIREFEGVGFRISNMYAKLESGRLLTLRAARMLDAGVNATKEVAAAKFTTADNQMDIVLDAAQICGGIGYTKEFPIERYLRDSKISQISAGTTDIMRYLVQRELYRHLNK